MIARTSEKHSMKWDKYDYDSRYGWLTYTYNGSYGFFRRTDIRKISMGLIIADGQALDGDDYYFSDGSISHTAIAYPHLHKSNFLYLDSHVDGYHNAIYAPNSELCKMIRFKE